MESPQEKIKINCLTMKPIGIFAPIWRRLASQATYGSKQKNDFQAKRMLFLDFLKSGGLNTHIIETVFTQIQFIVAHLNKHISVFIQLV